jgi:metabolite-proton symporter
MTNAATPADMPRLNSPARILFASLIGTTIEFFDFYIFATAAVIVFPKLFFPDGDPTSAILKSFITFALAFFARPVGSAVFGHFGDRIGRKATLVAALMTMGVSTVLIGCLPTYNAIGIAAPILLAVLRFAQGLGLGGEWGGAVLLATENAPEGKRAWYGMFPQLGAPIGFLCSSGVYLLLTNCLTADDFMNFGWRIPFIASALLVWVGLYVRLKIQETPEFLKALEKNEREAVPLGAVLRKHTSTVILGTVACIATFLLFYLMTVFSLSWGTTSMHIPKGEFISWQMVGILFFGAGIPLSAIWAEKIGQINMLIVATVLIILFGLVGMPLFATGTAAGVVTFLAVGLFFMGLTYGPLGTALAELFPTAVRYTGASLVFNFGGILGASLAPAVATTLANKYGLVSVGYYLAGASSLTLIALLGLVAKKRQRA